MSLDPEAEAWEEHYDTNLIDQDVRRLLNSDLRHPYVRQVMAACKKADRTLEFGCGKGTMSALLAMHKKAKPTLVDFSPTAIRYARQLFHKAGVKGRFQVCDLVKMPFQDDSFDLAYGKGVLEHIPGYETGMKKGLKEIFRVLRPGGKMVFTVPNSWRPDANALHNWVMQTRYTQYDFSVRQAIRMCEEQGFIIEKKFGDGVFYITPGEFIRFFRLNKIIGKRLPTVENQELRARERQSKNPGLLWRLNKGYHEALGELNKSVILPAEFSLMFGLRCRKPR